ncbi:MAG TPA: DUF58 domain-containing protein [Phycisphaerae bacterium]|nr:DUF58 domain-containing protein [Phycisphaerae bacterium]
MTLRLRFLDPDTVRRLTRLQITTRGLVEGFLAGVHASPYLGQSVEFAGHRSYVPGDEPKRIDWKIYGKRDRYFVKQFREETNFVACLLVDGSASMAFRSAGRGKLEHACLLAEALSLLVLRQNDAVACGVFDRDALSLSPPRHGVSFLGRLSDILGQIRPTGGTNIASSLRQFAEALPRRGIAVVISDFLDRPTAVVEGLNTLRLAGHEVIALQTLDPQELGFDFLGPIHFEGLEDSFNTRVEAQHIRQAYLRKSNEHLRDLRARLGRLGIEYRLTHTRQPIDALLRAFLAARDRHRRVPPWR